MASNWSLRNRVAVTLALFGAVVSLALAVIIYLTSHDLETRLIDDTLVAELDDYVARRQRNPLSLPVRTATIRTYVVAEQGGTHPIPEEVSALGPGRHSLKVDGISYRAAVREVREQRFVVLYDTSALQRRERGFLLLLSGSVLIVTLISALAGRWLAALIIAPVTELARRVARLHPEDEPTTLAREFPWLEIHQLAGDFDTYLKRLHDFIERERLFTGDVSHELRTPIAVINGATELLMIDPILNEKNRNRVARISRAATEMGEISAALLALAREQGDASSQSAECDILGIVQELITRYRDLFSHKPVELLLEVGALSDKQVDHAILSMVLGNLLRNALSFTAQGKVRIRLDAETIRIEDSGPGLDTANPAELFRPYVRGGQSNGAGLGLSLVWRLCEHQGWQITLENLPGGGTLAQLDLSPPSR
ncbi:sensor histidine kinase [Sedimenticola hydrogenitrophicus]|uniref:sensor histidine kinase n=1 Tax=Sedimenticola hydrogenitrophicus TaxID=2967975 RepID=UPI0023AEEE7F|nr:HAMP domain-containing sensor histidine kinase [Sedimenticola hydrogenitrophicus]